MTAAIRSVTSSGLSRRGGVRSAMTLNVYKGHLPPGQSFIILRSLLRNVFGLLGVFGTVSWCWPQEHRMIT
jgi:hypothetical protein